MSCSGLRIAPDPQYTAEIIVMMTSLGAKPKEFHKSKQAIDLLEIKRAHYKRIDFNKDNPSGSAEVKVLSMLAEAERIECSEDGDIHLPQVFVDGCNVGGQDRLQELEDDGQLSYMLWRTACPNCFSGREPEHEECLECGQEFIELMPGVQTIEEAIEFGEEAIDTDPYDSQAFAAIGGDEEDVDDMEAVEEYDEEEPAEEEEGGDIGKLTITEEAGEHDENEGPSLTDTMVGMASMEAAGEEVAAEEEEEEKEEEDVDAAAYKHEAGGDVRGFTKETQKEPPKVEVERFDDDFDEQDVGLVELDAEKEDRRLSILSNSGNQYTSPRMDDEDMEVIKPPVKRDSSSSLGKEDLNRRKSDASLAEEEEEA